MAPGSQGSPEPEDVEGILAFLLQAAREGQPAALVTLTEVVGSSARRVGSHMAVRRDGAWIGSFSGGCVEAAVAAESVVALDHDEVKEVRFGAGSPFIDIRLPCGGGIQLLVTPNPETEHVERALRMLKSRRPVALRLGRSGQRLRAIPAEGDHRTGGLPDGFMSVHVPSLRIVVAGHGAECQAFTRLARAWGAETILVSPDQELLRWAAQLGVSENQHLLTPESPVAIPTDHWTAILLLFHDHDWEVGLLTRLARQQSFYVGAMGSRRTHEARIAKLRAKGLGEEWLAGIRGPVGLFRSSRDPATIALSALAEIVAKYAELTSGQA